MPAALLRLPSDPQGLRDFLDQQFPSATPVPRRERETVATGIEALDAILPSGGFPRGRLSVWAPGGGATAILRAAADIAVAGGERAVWIDGQGTVSGAFWRHGPVLVRPNSRVAALRAAEALLRSGGFAFVALTGVEPAGNENVRLSRAAHEGGSALVALSMNAAMAGVKASSHVLPSDYTWRRTPHGDPALLDAVMLQVQVTSLGWNRRAQVRVSVTRDTAVRMALEAALPDRRGV